MKKLYISYDEATKFLFDSQKKYPDFIKVESIGTTWENREIYLATLSFDVKNADTKPALLYTGTIHAREWVGIEVAIAFIKNYLEGRDFDPRIENIFKKSTMYIVPCLNPDGFEYSRNHFSFWRKNRRVNADGTIGVDLNRNFSVGWQKNRNTSSNIYGGPAPFSEPETLAIKNFVDSKDNISIALDYHSQGNVFFPAHDFRHEDTIDTTDMNVLCANMAKEIEKVSERKFGIDQGKPPAKLIGGSGREYYYSKGIIASVVEVGTRNISDYQENMNEHINEQIPALLRALEEVNNYSKKNPLKRVKNFQIDEISDNFVSLKWDYEENEDIYFEIYRNTKDKESCLKRNMIGVTKAHKFLDTNVNSSTNYFYYIRAVNKKLELKSPFPPRIEIKTLPARDEFFKTIYALQTETGYLSENSKNNKIHFGKNSLFIGVSKSKGISEAVLTFSLKSVPDNAIIKSAKVSMYPINRVPVTIEKFGEWNVGIMKDSVDSIYDFNEIKDTKIQDIGTPIPSNALSQGIWQEWKMSEYQSKFLEKDIDKDKIRFKAFGPDKLKIGRDSQIMQWDIGYGKFGFGLNFRPKLDIVYTIPSIKLKLNPYKFYSLSKTKIYEKMVLSGFDANGDKIYGYVEFDLSPLPRKDKNIIKEAYIQLLLKEIKSKENVRYHIHMIDPLQKIDFNELKKAKKIDKIGYDKSVIDIKDVEDLEFLFETYSIEQLENRWNKKIAFVIIPTIHKGFTKNAIVEWKFRKQGNSSSLLIEYIKKRRKPLSDVSNLKVKKEKGKLKLTWKNPIHKDFRGVYIVKNAHRVPKSPYDGQKIYAGMDNYTFDTFGALDRDKYFAVFTYDNVPNYSKGVSIFYKGE
jgi:carboxypeptidase T